jgi:hypothetical protein
MPSIDITVSADLQEAFQLPPCEDIKLPFPSPLKVTLPTGGSISALADISKGIPTDCSMTFSLMLQIAPLLASLECLLKVLGLLKPLIDVINGLPVPPVKAILDFGKAAADLAPCLLIPTPLNMIPFVKDLLCLILKALKCFLQQMKSLLGLLGGLSHALASAQGAGNAALISSLQCAQGNAQAQAAALGASIQPLAVILELMGTVMGIAGVQPIQLPSLDAGADLTALNTFVEDIQGVVGILETVTEALGGC